MKNLILPVLLVAATCCTMAFYPHQKTAALPDLTITNVEDDCSLPGFFVTVKNIGNATASACQMVVATDDVSAPGSLCLNTYLYPAVPLLKPGAEARIKVVLTNTLNPKFRPANYKTCFCSRAEHEPYLYVISVNGTNIIEESDTGNNLWTDPDREFPDRHEYITFQ